MNKKKIFTICIVHNDTHVLLGFKKCGFGEGKWNGFGGKVEEGETIEDAARRELLEEAGIVPADIKKRGVCYFYNEESIPKIEMNIYGVKNFSGEPRESDEMKPKWFMYSEIPFNSMWPDDVHWMPLFLSGKNFKGEFHFNDVGVIIRHSIKEI